MISLDWIERIKKDTLDFCDRKLPAKDYDVDIIYNAYPERIENKIPQAVLTLVGKTMSAKIAKEADKYFDFYDYLLLKKGDNGKFIFAYLMEKAVNKKPDVFLAYIETVLFRLKEQKDCNLIIDKAIFPLLKKKPEAYLDLMNTWIKKDNAIVCASLQKMLIKLITKNPNIIKPLFQKLETNWLYATENMIKVNVALIKAIYKIDKDFYFHIYERYQTTRNPIFAEILCHAIVASDSCMTQLVESWCRSGNVKLKKIGLHGKKIMNKMRK
jgi:hypothetical protein